MGINLAHVVGVERAKELASRRANLIIKADYLANDILFLEEINPNHIEGTIDLYLNSSNLTPDERVWLLKKAYTMAYGDPLDVKRKQYTILYHNPTGVRVVIGPMGLKDENGDHLESIAPGGIVHIPQAYTRGEKRSTVHSVAPQLKPVGNCKQEKMFLCNPTSWDEWVKFFPYTRSKCCKDNVSWLDSKQRLECEGCGLGVGF